MIRTLLFFYIASDGVSYLKVSPGGKISNINKSFATLKTNPQPQFATLAISPDTLRYTDSCEAAK